MPATVSSGRVAKVRNSKNTTPHQKNHRWESFTTKISKLNSLDPLRKVRRHDLDDEDLSAATSYFRNGVDKWSDLNISKHFTNFRREILPLSDTLPHIIHFQDKIMDLLVTYINLQEKEALEPLLDLLTAFAHDLGVKFEKFYQRSLELLVVLASKPRDVEVIEWTFAAMAWLFKYLSRLLVPDLRPTYDMLAPLLGKTKHPYHITRFAAEAMSFLIKKAAAPSTRETALPLIIEHTRNDIRSLAESLARKNKEATDAVTGDELKGALRSKQFEQYQLGLMTMFSEAMKSSGHSLHSNAPFLFTALLDAVPYDEFVPGTPSFWTDVCCGVLINIIHHSTPDTFKILGDSIVAAASAKANAEDTKQNPWRLSLFLRLFGIMSGVRDGSRVTDWAGLIQTLSTILDALSKDPENLSRYVKAVVWEHAMANTATCWNQSPMDALIPAINGLTKILAKEAFMGWYIPFCAYLADLNETRFRSLFQKPFQKFIASHWSNGDNEEMLCVLLPKMVASGALPRGGAKDSCPLPQSWQDQIVSKFEELGNTPFPERGSHGKNPDVWRDKCLPRYSALLRVLESTSVHPSTNARIAELLLKKLKLALRPSSSLATEETRFIVTQGFLAYLRMSKASGSVDGSLSPLLKAAAPRFSGSATFLEALLGYEREAAGKSESKNSGSESPATEDDPFLKSLINNLSSSSRPLRLASLNVFGVLPTTPDQESCLAAMLIVEQLPFDHESPRAIALQLRRLAAAYAQLDEASWLRQAVPAYLFGMLTVPLSPVWDDAVVALKQISQTKSAQEAIASRGFEWLDIPSPRWTPPQLPSHLATGRNVSNFVCLNFSALQERARQNGKAIEDTAGILLKEFEQAQDVAPNHVPNARGKALKVLTAVPAVAEQRSRKLVPFLLSLDSTREASSEDEDEEHKLPRDDFWSLVDRKALLGVFAQFGNPKVLYQSQAVYDALLSLLANRDIEIQKLALKAVLAWKQGGVKPYRENLEYLLDEARFKNELTVLLQGETSIQAEHRSELMPVLLRVLYGRATSKKGAASGRHGLHATRLAVIRNLSVTDLGGFLDIALGELRGIRVMTPDGLQESVFKHELVPLRKQVGFLNMVEPIIKELGTSVDVYMDSLVNAVLYCLFSASRNLRHAEQVNEEEDDASVDDEKISETSLLKVARTTALKSLCALIRNNPDFDWAPYQDALVAEVVSPVIDLPPGEMAQGISWTWRLMDIWSSLPGTAMILTVNENVISKTVECVGFDKSKNEVRIFALGIVRNLVKLATAPENNGLVKSQLLDPNADKILNEIGTYLRMGQNIEIKVLEACVDTVVEISSVVDGSRNARNLIEISTYLLNQPSRRVSPKVKGALLLILEHYITLDNIHEDPMLKKSVFETLSSLFGYFKDKRNRESLSKVLLAYATRDESMQEVANICSALNSFVNERLDEPDYDRRLTAFNGISRRDVPFTIEQWMPLLHNMVFYLQQDEEFGILTSNSADGLCRFVDAAAAVWGEPSQADFVDPLGQIIMPAIHAGVREISETVRRETLRLLGHLVEKMRDWTPVADLSTLIPSADEDASKAFFYNILTPSVSKQLQAVQLLAAANARSEFSSKNISHIFLPLLEHFIWGRAGADDHGLGAQATGTIGVLAGSLEWSQYRALLRRYSSYLESKPELSKQVIRLLDKVVEALVSAVPEVSDETAMDVDVDEGAGSVEKPKGRLAKSVPNQAKLGDEFSANFLPPLLDYLHDKNEETVSARVPVAVIIVKLLRLLPEDLLNAKLPSVLTDLCHILRSKAQEAREMSRNTLAKIACILGPSSFGFVLGELRGALKSGTQLHVLSYTMHTILLAVIPEFKQGDIDYSLDSMVAVIMDDIFGVTGQEKDAEAYVSKMKEVKTSKSQDSMELIASTASVTRLVELVRPLQALLQEKLSLRMVHKIDELLNRVSSGLQKNPASDSRDVLILCYEIIQEVYNSRKPKTEKRMDPRLRRYLIQKGATREDRGTFSKHTYKLMRFAIDILRSVLKKHESLRTASNLASFLPILGDAIVGGEEEVKLATFRLLVVLVRVPYKTNDLADLYKVASKDAIKSISQSVSTTTELSQTSLKLISVILRDRRDVAVKDAAIDMLLGKLKDDLTEPLFRHITFNFLRSVLDRKIETAAVYDTLDYVGTVMITNDDKNTRDLARGAFFQFLKDYPQKKSRWAKQIEFVLANLQYPREGGRLSVMEIIHLLLMKSADDFVKEVAATCFFPLVLLLGNDESERCRLAAGELIKEIFRKVDKERLKEFLGRTRSWVEQEGNPAVTKLAFQIFSFYFEVKEASPKDKTDLNLLVSRLTEVLGKEDTSDWELTNSALVLVQVLLDKHPARILSSDSVQLWTGVFSCMSHPRAEVQLTAVTILAKYLSDFSRSANAASAGQVVTGSYGQVLEQDHITQIIRELLTLLSGLEIEEALAKEGVRILVFLVKFLDTNATEEESESSEDEEDDEDDEDDFFKDEEDTKKKEEAVTMRYIFWRLTAIIRRETRPAANTLVSKLAAIEALEIFCERNEKDVLEPSMREILRPLRNLTDTSIPAPFSLDELFKTRYEALKTKAQQIMDLLQNKLGTADYTKHLLVVGEEIKDRRQNRSGKRKVEAITAPEKYGREKRKKMESKKNRRKAKGQEHRSARRP